MDFTARAPEEEVARSAAWLDTVRPRWVDRIDVDTLNLSSGHRCVLGQVFDRDAKELHCGSGFVYGLRVIGNSGVHPDNLHGFHGRQHESAWKALITERSNAE